MDIEGHLGLGEVCGGKLPELVRAGIFKEKEYIAQTTLSLWDPVECRVSSVKRLVCFTYNIEDAHGAGDQRLGPAGVFIVKDTLFDFFESVDEFEISEPSLRAGRDHQDDLCSSAYGFVHEVEALADLKGGVEPFERVVFHFNELSRIG